MNNKLGKKFWLALVVFSLIGQVAWVVENMYLNVFIYKMFNASANDISLMVSCSAIAATLTTIIMGAFSDYIGKRKLLMCGGYILWGVSILAFAFIRMDILTPIAGSTVAAASLGVTLVIVLDCIMTFLGSTANDAAFNAWMTDWGNDDNRGTIEGINAMMPLVSILVVFGGFMFLNLDKSESWTIIFAIIGGIVLVIGIIGLFIIKDAPGVKENSKKEGYFETIVYSFRPSVIKENKLLYVTLVAFAVFGISIQVFMPYLILYYEKGLGMTNYVLVMAPAILIAAIVTALYGKLFDMLGFKMSVMPTIIMLMVGYTMLYFGKGMVVVFIGSLLMLSGYLTGMAIFGAMIRSHIPENKSGQFQGIRIIGQVLIPGTIGPAISAFILRDAEIIVNNDGTESFIPNEKIFLGAFIIGIILLVVLGLMFRMMKNGHYQLISENGEKLLANRDGVSSNYGDGADNSENCVDSWTSYPRPQLKRNNYTILKEGWTLNGDDIHMPFPPQSYLSGYNKKVSDELEYKVNFKREKKENERTILHFGAVDQIAKVYINGTKLRSHEGGYLPFSYDITEFLKDDSTVDNELIVKVTDKLDKKYPYGKQCKKRGGMWYTPVSGIWQNVWLEDVPDVYVEKIYIKPTSNTVRINLFMNKDSFGCEGPRVGTLRVELHDGNIYEKQFVDGEVEIDFTQIEIDGAYYEPKKWSTDDPYLYNATISIGEDEISTYFALREIEIKNIDGVNRVCLNDEPIFMNGVLDQGYFCDGIFLPACEEEYEQDILRMKELGINMLRKHIKIEPECFYYYCDLHGMLVMQDMVNNGSYSFIRDTALPTIGVLKKDDTKFKVSREVKNVFEKHMVETQKHLFNHPCIVAYTLFNEGWGQFDSDRIYEMAKRIDPTRLYDSTSGWFAQSDNDFDSYHVYFGDNKPQPKQRPLFMSEFGGYSYAVPGHVYAKFDSYGYGACKDSAELTERIKARYEELIIPIVKSGACGCVYTQLSDVEDEINGFYTYDRKVCKVDKKAMQEIAAKIKEELK